MSTFDAVDLFCGLGWGVAMRRLGLDEVGIDIDPDVCNTRALHGMATIRADVSTYPAEMFAGVDGLIASPPCQDFSVAGSRAGLEGDRGKLVWQVPRWVTAVRPRWVACEQTPTVLPIWKLIARELEALGYRTWSGVLSSERYGVPQTRDRAVLLAHRDRAPQPPTPTHQEYVPGQSAQGTDAGMFCDGLLPWVSMADAVGWPETSMVEHRRGAGMIERHGEREPRPATAPAPTITAGARRRFHVLHTRCGWHGEEVTRRANEPAPTVTVKATGQWLLTVDEAAILQSFPADFTITGTIQARGSQIGNAVPPLLAERIIEAVAS